MRYCILISSIILALTTTAAGETYMVNPEGTGDFPTIQAAIDAVVNGDIIELTDGTFTGDGNRNIDYHGKAITIRSQNGNPGSCIIDCEGMPGENRRGFVFQSGEGSESILRGITIMRGLANGACGTRIGGAVSCHNEASPTIDNCVFLGNRASLGGALYCHTASPNLATCAFRTNSATRVGGGVCCDSLSAPVFTNCTFEGNKSHANGGGIHAVPTSKLTLVGCELIGNTVGVGGGGACYCDEAWLATSDCVFNQNSAAERGGALDCWGCSALVTRCVFTANSAFGVTSAGMGGAICFQGDSSPLISECSFSGNMIQSSSPICSGGAVHSCIGCTPTFQSCTFTGNTADGPTSAGGGVCSSTNCAPSFENCMFRDNAAAWGGGLAHWSSASPASVIGCEFTGNCAEWTGGALDLGDGIAHLQNCTLSDNAADEGGGLWCNAGSSCELENSIVAFSTTGAAVFSETAGAVTLRCCDLFGNAGGDWVGHIADQLGIEGNICADPLFCGDLNPLLPYLLHGDSPCAPDYNPECGLVGAWPVGCGSPQAAQEATMDRCRLFLDNNIPNPFASSTRIIYTIGTGSDPVLLNVYDASGRLLRTLVDASLPTGTYSITWDGTNQVGRPVEGGVYFYQVRWNGKSETGRMLLVR